MQPEIKSVYSLDVVDVKGFVNNDTELNILWRVMMGEKGSDAYESFDFEICNIAFLQSLVNSDSLVLGKGFIIVDSYRYEQILARIEKLINSLNHNTWEDFAIDLSKYANWEFDNYKE